MTYFLVNSQPKTLIKYVKRTLIFSGIIAACTFVAYFLKFHDGFSSQQGDWGTFGDFVGGTLNAIIGVANIFITAVIAILIQRLGDEARTIDLEKQKQIILIEFKYTSIKEFYAILHRLNETIGLVEITEKTKSLEKLHSDYTVFKGVNKAIWHDLEGKVNEDGFDVAFSSLIDNIEQYHTAGTVDANITEVLKKGGAISSYMHSEIMPKF